jgi:putative glutamine amidotransferase
MTKPVVLLTPDVESRVSQRRGDTSRVHVIDRAYTEAVERAGGIPLVAPYGAESLVERADAVVLTGGAFDVDPALFGEEPHPALGTLKPDRTKSERAIYARAVERGLPMLGVCGGMQLMNVERGGTLWQDLHTQAPSDVPHEQDNSKAEAGHDVEVAAGTKLAAAVGAGTLGVNSTHHQAVRSVGDGLVETAVAPDGIVEAFEDPSLPFFVGVQWHPEAMADPRHLEIYRALIDAAS